MKVIEKVTNDNDIQIFEIITSKKELRKQIKLILWDSLYSDYKTGIWEDGDSSLYFIDNKGKYYHFSEGDSVKKINLSNIVKLAYYNTATIMIYGNIPIIQNEHYRDWEVNFD